MLTGENSGRTGHFHCSHQSWFTQIRLWFPTKIT